MTCTTKLHREGALRTYQYVLTARDVQAHAAQLCQQHLRFRDHGPPCTAGLLFTLLCYAAARIGSLSAACKALRDAPIYTAVHDALLATLPDLPELQRRVNRALQGDLPKTLRRKAQPLAIDLILIPDPSEPFADPAEIYPSQPKQGTSHCPAYAPAYVVCKACRYPVAMTAVTTSETRDEGVPRLRRQVAKAGVPPRYLRWDRGFYSGDVIRYLPVARAVARSGSERLGA